MKQDGTDYTVLRSLAGSPTAGLTEGEDGVLYGTQVRSRNVFKINKDGSGYAELFPFFVRNDDSMPGPVVWGWNRTLYGTAAGGGSASNCIAFRLNQDGSDFAVLHTFAPVGGDGISPTAALLRASDGAFYGVTGGGDYLGTVFTLFSDPTRITAKNLKKDGAAVLLSLCRGAAGQTYSIKSAEQFGTNVSWRTIGSARAAIDGSFQFRDSNAPNYSVRFYRGAAP